MIEDTTLLTQIARPTGPGASAIKYDVITALSVMALHDGPTLQTTVLRLVALITARYNWKADQFCVSQDDMARMWNVSDRTVKREIKRMISAGLIRCIRPGRRGRVGAYRLDYPTLFANSSDTWAAVGSDFADRMSGLNGAGEAKVVKVDFAARKPMAPDETLGDDLWGRVQRALAQASPENQRNWYAKLIFEGIEGGVATLRAPSGFVANFVRTHLAATLTAAVSRELGAPVRLHIHY